MFASNLNNKTKQNQKKKKPKKETVNDLAYARRKLNNNNSNNNKNRNIALRFIAVSWFRCFYDDRYSGGGVVEKSNCDSVQRKTAHTVIPRWTL